MVDKVAGNNRWCTPSEALAPVKAYGPIGLDPCTEADNPAGAATFFTEDDDGLVQDWRGHGLVFVNPPYSTLDPLPELPPNSTAAEKRKHEDARRKAKREYMAELRAKGEALFGLEPRQVTSLIVLWAVKIHEAVRSGAELIALLPCGARFGTEYWQDRILVPELRAVCFVRGRIPFIDATTGKPGSGGNNYDSMFYGFNVNASRFCSAFQSMGVCFETKAHRAGLLDGFI